MILEENRELLLTTKEAAAVLRRSAQTLRVWSMNDSGPIRPVRTRPRAPLLWRFQDIQQLISGDSEEQDTDQ